MASLHAKWTSCVAGVLLVLGAGATFARTSPIDDAEDASPEVPAAFAPFEAIVGGWKGQAFTPKNRLKGWPEKHLWSWKFAKGKPVGMTVELTGSKIFATARLSHDAKTETYLLDGTDPAGKPIRFVGKLDTDLGVMSLLREKPPAEIGKERLDFAVNASKIRYTMRLFRQEPGAPQFALAIDANLGKEGESFAAGGAASDLPKCIVTGGAGTMMVSFEGKSFPICCSGCRDEFNDNPAKYVAKALAKSRGGAASPVVAAPSPSPSPKPPADTPKTMPAPEDDTDKTPSPAPAEASADAKRAKSVLAQGQSLEKAGKTQAAVIYYKRIVKDYPATPSAKIARARLDALGEK